jgi:hypothetical protein
MVCRPQSAISHLTVRCGIAVDNGDKGKTAIACFHTRTLTIVWCTLEVRYGSSSDLAVRVSAAQRRETFRLPIDAARCKAREAINQIPQNGLNVDR